MLKLPIAETMKMDEEIKKQSGYKIDNINRVLQSNNHYVGQEYLENL